jgi:hypothetical protein
VSLVLVITQYFFLIFYLFYALCIFVFSLQGKVVKPSAFIQCFIIAFLLLLSTLVVPNIGSSNNYVIDYILLLEIFAVFGCTQLIPLKRKHIPNSITISPLQKLSSRSTDFIGSEYNICYSKCLLPEVFPMIKGIFMVIVRITYFALLAKYITTNFWVG